MKPETMLVALLLAVGVFFGTYTFVFDIAEDNNIVVDESDFKGAGGQSFFDSFVVFNETKDEIDAVQQDFTEVTLSDDQDVFSFLQLAFTTLKQILESLNIVKSVFTSLGTLLGIPPMWIGIFTTIMFLVALLAVIFIILGRTY